MVQWLLSLPKKVLVVLVLTTAIVFIVAQDPPHTLCRTQIENFKLRQKGKIYKNPNIKTRKKPLMEIVIMKCRESNSPGNCYELFSKTKDFIRDFKTVSLSCRDSLSSLSKVRSTLFEIYRLMIQLAWGDGSSKDHYDKTNWLSSADVSLFCAVKENIVTFYGSATLLNLERKVFKKLPGTKKMSENRIRELALVSQDCAIYL